VSAPLLCAVGVVIVFYIESHRIHQNTWKTFVYCLFGGCGINAFKMTSSNSSPADKSCACAYIAFLEGIFSWYADSIILCETVSQRRTDVSSKCFQLYYTCSDRLLTIALPPCSFHLFSPLAVTFCKLSVRLRPLYNSLFCSYHSLIVSTFPFMSLFHLVSPCPFSSRSTRCR
jgi:hypothetical protein